MRETVIRALKVLLPALGAILIVLLLFGTALMLGWPWWMGFFLVAVAVGMVAAFFLVRRFLARRREQRFVQEVISQDEARLKTLGEKERAGQKDLQNRWREAVESLKRSHLRKLGNPLYVLPWYLVIGESGSGKTTAISSAQLTTFSETNRVSGISGTRNFDWWFFDQAVLLDTAGRYAIPVDEGRDKEEWQKFLALLVKYRKKEPIHGLIVTVAADKLLEAGPGAMEEDGRNIRRRIDETMRALGARFPVYVLVTKCDLVQGMTRFCDLLPEKALVQPMGCVNRDLSTDVGAFLERALEAVGERLRAARLLLLDRPEARGGDPGVLTFPEEFGSLRPGLESFMKAAFQSTPYQETPILRGVYFSSGRQEGSPYSRFLGDLGLIGEKEVLPGTNRGLFLHEFFAKLLPRDRGLFAPTRRALEWSLLTRNLGLTTWVVAGIALCGLLSYSFVKNLGTVREASREAARFTPLIGETVTDLLTMERFSRSILAVEGSNRGWWVPRFGLKESLRLEEGLKEKFCRQFREGFLVSFDRKIAQGMAGLSSATPDGEASQYADHLVRRINILQARLRGGDTEAVSRMPLPSLLPFLEKASTGASPEVRKSFGAQYRHYLSWRTDTPEINREIGILQGWLRHLLTVRGGGFQWLVAWADTQEGVSPVRLKEFWGGSGSLPWETPIPAAFTQKGREAILAFLGEIRSALSDPIVMEGQEAAFREWYPGSTLSAWHAFAGLFPRGVECLAGRKDWQQAAGRTGGPEGPYQAFLSRLTSELDFLADEEKLPDWVRQVYRLQSIRSQATRGDLGAKASEKGKKILARIEKMLEMERGGGFSDAVEVQKAYQEYQGALSQIASASSHGTQTFQLASQAFSEDPATGKTPIHTAQGAAGRLGKALGGGRPPEQVVSTMVTGPLDFLWAYVRNEAGCQLQAQWEQAVLAETQGATGSQVAQFLFGPEGPVTKFAKGPAAPFLVRTPQGGYVAREVLGGKIPFEAPFLAFLAKGSSAVAGGAGTGQVGPVTVQGLPTDTNPDARVKPHLTRLHLQCADGPQTLENLNYPITRVFRWSPGVCGDVTLQIEVGNRILKKQYPGEMGFPSFLMDFPGGRHTFRAAEFPGEGVAFQEMGIRYVRVNFRFTGEGGVIRMARSAPGRPPGSIAACWGP